MRPPPKTRWVDIKQSFLLGEDPVDEIRFLRRGGEVDWSTVTKPHELIMRFAKGSGFSSERTAVIELLRLARDEFAQGGHLVFKVHEGQPLRHVIGRDDAEVMIEFLEAGLNPLAPDETLDGGSVLEMAKKWGSTAVLGVIRSHLARRAAEDALQDIAAPDSPTA